MGLRKSRTPWQGFLPRVRDEEPCAKSKEFARAADAEFAQDNSDAGVLWQPRQAGRFFPGARISRRPWSLGWQ